MSQSKMQVVPGVASFYDTVLIDGNCASYELFRDLQDKSKALTNLRVPRRLPAGSSLRLTSIEVDWTLWGRISSGVQLDTCTLVVRRNMDMLYEGKLKAVIDVVDVTIADDDDLIGEVRCPPSLDGSVRPMLVRVVLVGELSRAGR